MKSLLRAWASLAMAAALPIAAWGHAATPKKRTHHSAATKTASTSDASTTSAKSANSSSSLGSTAAGSAIGEAQLTDQSSSEETPKWIPMAATSGGLGLFTLDSGDTITRHGMAFEIDANKFSRNPGSITVLESGWSVGYGITDKLTALFQWNVHNHVHVDNPAELSLDSGTGGQFGNTIYNSIVPEGTPAYVEDYPFAYANDGGVGDIDIGAKYGLLSEKRGDRLSLALRGDVFVPTKTSIPDLLVNQSQSGALDFQFGVGTSKSVLGDDLVLTGDLGYRVTRDPGPEFNNSPALTRADQINAGFGFLMFPQSRVQIMSEYTSTVFVGAHTPNTTFGARDPIDTVWGVRIYVSQMAAIDIGYRYMLNLGDVLDRNGFVVKLGGTYWPEEIKPLPQVSVQLTVQPTEVQEGSNAQVTATTQTTDSQNYPLTYSWTADAGNIIGTGPNVRWDSTGVKAGTYTLNATAEDTHGGTATAAAQITVTPKPIPPPTMNCSVDRSSVMAGEKVSVTASVNDLSNTPLTYQWLTNGGQILGTGGTVQLDTTGLAPGNYTVTGRVQDAKGGAAACTASVTIQTPPPPPQASKINECSFRLRSARVDNVCKRILDDVAVRMQNDPKARVVIIGYATPRRGHAQRLADQLTKDRAESAKKYLAEKKGVDAARIETRSGAGAGKACRRIAGWKLFGCQKAQRTDAGLRDEMIFGLRCDSKRGPRCLRRRRKWWQARDRN